MKKIVSQWCGVIENRRLDKSGWYYRLKLSGFAPPRAIHPGQFVHLKVAPGVDPFFRRAFSISDFETATGVLEIIYKVAGRGTTILRDVRPGTTLDLIGPLGNRFTVPPKSQAVVLVAGGVGLPPIAFLARYLVDRGHNPRAIFLFYGGRTREDLIEVPRLRRTGVNLVLCTDDGSRGFKGMVTEAVMQHMSRFDGRRFPVYGCGPEPMLAAVQEMALANRWSGEMSLEAPMPCGVGVCLGCIKPSLSAPGSYVRVCHDGPVFKIGEVQL